MRNLLLIANTVWLQALRRKDIYVVFILAGFFGVWVLASRIIGIETEGTANFLMSLGLSASYVLAAAIAIALGSRQLPGEFESRTLYPLLARPVSRGEIFLGKAIGVAGISIASLLLLIAITYLPTPKGEEHRAAVLAQAIALQMASLVLLVAMTMALSIVLPPAVTMLVALAVFWGSGPIVNFATSKAGEWGSGLGTAARHALSIVPDFSMFNQVQRFVEAQSAAPAEAFFGMLLYAAALSAVMYLAAAYAFGRKMV